MVAQTQAMNSGGGPMLSSTLGRQTQQDHLSGTLGNPGVYKENLEHIRSQMLDIKNESIAMEHEMENRMKSMTIANQQRKYLPKSLTEEVEDNKYNTQGNPQVTEVLTEYDRTKRAVLDKLGGEFDYSEFTMDLKDLMSEKDHILSDFRKTKLNIPPPAPKGVTKYNFKVKGYKKKAIVQPTQQQKIKVPEYNYDNKDSDVQEVIKKQKNLPVGSEPRGQARPSSRPQRNIKAQDFDKQGKSIHTEQESQKKKINVPETDLLTIKNMVVEEIKNDLEYNKVNGKYVDPFERRDNIDNGTDHIETVGIKQPLSEDAKMHSLTRETKRNLIKDQISEQNEEIRTDDQNKILEAMTDMILEEYMNHNRQTREMENMSEDQKRHFHQRDNVSSFMASLNQTHNMDGTSAEPSVQGIEEDALYDKIHDIFQEVEQEKKNKTMKNKSIERQRTIESLNHNSTQQFKKSKKKIAVSLDDSWDGSVEETKNPKKSKKDKKNKYDTIEEDNEEETPYKINRVMPAGQNPGARMIQVPTEYVEYGYPPPQQQPGMNLGDIQQIVQMTIANEMKKNINYLDKRNNYPGAQMVQQPEIFETHKLSKPLLTDEEARLMAEENELKKGIPINIAPFAQQTLGINVNRPLNAAYTNPFLGNANPSTGLNPPRLVNLDDYELSSESDLYSEVDRTYSDSYSDPNLPSKVKGKNRYDIVRDSEGTGLAAKAEHHMLDSANFNPRKKPGILEEDLDPEIEAARRTYKKRGRIDIAEEDEDE